MKKQLLFILMMMLPMLANADSSGTCGENVTWKYEETTKTLTISGSGKMENYNSRNNSPWYSLRENILNVIISNGVTSIGSSAFQDCSILSTINIPNSVTSIGNNALLNCSSVTFISVPSSVASIGLGAFANCSSLSSINVSPNNQIYDSRDNCNAIVETGSNKLIAGCHNTIIPNSVTSIGSEAFCGCSSLKSILIPNSVAAIGSLAFADCKGLTSLTITNNTATLGSRVFNGCDALNSVTIPVFDLAAFCNNIIASQVYTNGKTTKLVNDVGDEIKDYVIPNSVTSVSSIAFVGCAGLSSVTIPSSVTYFGQLDYMSNYPIGDNAFIGCSGLISITVASENPKYDSRDNCNAIIETGSNTLITGCQNTIIPSSVLAIGNNAFNGCSRLSSINIPNSLCSIGPSAFRDCNSLKTVNINSISSWCNISFNDNPLNYAEYLQLNGETITDLVLPNTLASVNNKAFYGYSALKSLSIPNSIITIGSQAFDGCRLENILTKNSKTICNMAFSERSYQHAMLYIPEGTWGEAVYDGDWYMFNNIREMAMSEESLMSSRVYLLIDTKTFSYAVYDEARNEVKMAKAFYSIDEYDPNSCWQMIIQNGQKYLYNIGAKKYATIADDGKITLTTYATALLLKDEDDGIVLGANPSHKWGFVKNNAITDITNVEPLVSVDGYTTDVVFSLEGQCITKPVKGLNIVRTSNGKAKKVMVK